MRGLALLALVAIGCGDRGAELPAADLTAERFTTRGKVMKVEGHTLDIFHEHMPKIRSIDGALVEMAPMTMQFSATAAAPIDGIAVGDVVKIEFTTHYRTPAPLRLVSIEKLPARTQLATAGAPPAPPAPPPPTCIAKNATVVDARLADGVLTACYVVGKDDECWRFDVAKSTWSFAMRRAHVEETRRPPVTVTPTSAVVCTPEGSDCKSIPLSGTGIKPDDLPAGATNDDRSIVAVWGSGSVHVFDANGKKLTEIKPWPTPMTGGNGVSFFREAHVLGSTIEVRIADTPVSAAIRLFDVRGRKIADVFGGVPMEDGFPPLALGGSRYAFIKLDAPRTLVIVDVATGKLHGSYPLPGEVLASTVMLRDPGDNVIGVIGPHAVRVDLAAKKLVTVTAPTCP